MEHELVKPNGDASDAQVIESGGLYPFDAPETSVEIPRGKGTILTITFQKPELQNYLDLEKATQLVSRMVDGALVDETQRHSANADFYDQLVVRASKRKKDQIKPNKEYDAEECRNFTFEIKDEAVSRMNASFFEVVGDDEDDLFERAGTMKVRQTIGDEASPSYVIEYEMNSLPKAQRLDYETAIQVKRKVEKGKTRLETEVHVIKKAMKLFAPNFIAVEGGKLVSGPYSPERKVDFIIQIDPIFQVGVVDCLVGYYSKGSD